MLTCTVKISGIKNKIPHSIEKNFMNESKKQIFIEAVKWIAERGDEANLEFQKITIIFGKISIKVN